MPSHNHVELMGNLTRDIELKYTDGGLAVCEVGVAVNERRKKGDKYEDFTTFVDVTLWGRDAENSAQYLSKGSLVFIVGRLQLSEWESEGKKRSKLKVVANRIQFLDSKSKSESKQSFSPKSEPVSVPGDDDSEIPF